MSGLWLAFVLLALQAAVDATRAVAHPSPASRFGGTLRAVAFGVAAFNVWALLP